MQTKLYTDYSDFLNRYFSQKVQKISIHAGFTCPNRDGTIGIGGCTYCNNQTFSPEYCHTGKTIAEQLNEGIRFFSRKYPAMCYLAYFQAYTNTYATLEKLKRYYEEALSVEGVVGLVIGTRPDCMPDSLLYYLQRLAENYFVLVEYGVETTDNRTLSAINRGHSWETAQETIGRTAQAGLLQGVHCILGLPGESHQSMMQSAAIIGKLPLQTVKLHQLQLIRHTKMAEEYANYPERFRLYDVDEYIDLAIDYIERIPPHIAIERFTSQSPKELLIAPNWGLKNYEFTHRLLKRMKARNSYQGRLVSEITPACRCD